MEDRILDAERIMTQISEQGWHWKQPRETRP